MEVQVLGWLHCSLSLCFPLLQCSVYLILAAGALTQQRLAALVNVHSTIWKTAGQEHRVSVVSGTGYAVYRGNSGGFWTEYGREQRNIKPSLKFQKPIQQLPKAVFKRLWFKQSTAMVLKQTPGGRAFSAAAINDHKCLFPDKYSHHKVNESLLAAWNWCGSNSVVSVCSWPVFSVIRFSSCPLFSLYGKDSFCCQV